MAHVQPVNILLVDDRSENLVALASILENPEHNLVTAHSGTEALKCLLKQDFAVILMDVQMPGLDGFETAEMIRGRERSQSTPIIFLTALDHHDGGMFRGYSVGAVDFLFKPLIPEVLRSKVAVFVELFKKSEEIQQQAAVLEERVHERTAALTMANTALVAEIRERQRAEQKVRFLAEATTILTETLDYEHTLDNLTRLAVPYIADLCSVYISGPDGIPCQLAVHHPDPAKVEQAREIDRLYPASLEMPDGPTRAIMTGMPALIPEMTEEALVGITRNAEHLTALRSLGFTSLMIVPLCTRVQAIGVLVCASIESGRRYAPTDLEFAQELASRAALAVDNALLYREAQRALEIRDDFLSVAAHELKTPIAAIVGHVQLLQRWSAREGTLTERHQRALRTINDQAARLTRLIHAVLDISRLQVGQLSIERMPLDLNSLARRVVDETAQTLERHTIVLPELSSPLMVEGDELRLEQVLQNLLQNAVKYSPAGGTIHVDMSEDGDTVSISVSDQGIGIPAAALDRLYTRFYRADNVDGTHIGGMGVGLYVVKEIVSLHGGAIEVQSTEGQGSTFTVRLPRDLPAVEAETTYNGGTSHGGCVD
ncbi:MAG: hypothetical protein NVS4B8_07930 [Herpetosiphon sp.]